MPRPTLDKALADLIAKLEPELREAFLAAIDDMRDGIDMRALRRALEAGDIDAAIRALNIEVASFSQYLLARQAAFAAAGALQSAHIPTRDAESVVFRFDMSNPRAEAWIREQSATRITGYVQEQVEAARETIVKGYSRGEGPQQIAVDIAGRVDRASGRRSGGIVGLSEPQAGYVSSMRERLLSGDPREMRKVIDGMTLRDRRYDRLIQKHIDAGTPLSRTDVEKLTARYSDRLLKRRAEDIARTETQQSVFGARKESYRQALEREGLPDDALTKTWRHQGGGEDSRLQHIAMNRKTVDGLDTPFILPDGTAMQHPHDPAGGAKHTINCRCGCDFRIKFGYGQD